MPSSLTTPSPRAAAAPAAAASEPVHGDSEHATASLLAGCAVVVAHPDDEVLWASSLLTRARDIVVCFGEVASAPELTAGRQVAMRSFPLPQLRWLDIRESEVYWSAGWPDPKSAPEGLAVRRRPRSMSGYSASRYRENYARIRAHLQRVLVGVRDVVTHNPWGEYGHEDHVQVFRAVESLQATMGFRLWVTGYASNRSAALMRTLVSRLGEPTPPLPTDALLTEQLRRHYIATNTWTWFPDYAWPTHEVFLPWLPAASADARIGRVVPIHVITMPDPPVRTAYGHIRWLTGRMLRAFGLRRGD